MTVEIEKLRGGKPSLLDIPGQLRQLADNIETGEYTAPSSVLVVVPRGEGEWPEIFNWGVHMADNQTIGVLEITKTYLVVHRVVRKS